ncbi:MAG: AmmeMemoRadiSam system protein B [Proteobacteria bacterium]|nr:AmmeMemoRadiSam system protein B [Pseudomonadota bacterium]MBU1736720.1 AmmeMemoRadiSam system protein B [Pseudomonadota bacterium]
MSGHPKRTFCEWIVSLLVLALVAVPVQAATVRDPVWAGSFYPGESKALEDSITRLTEQAAETVITPPTGKILKALVMPHAGYIYSGWTAAHVSHVLQKGSFSRVVLIGPDHRVGIAEAAVSDAELFRTPLGFIRIDKSAAILRNQSDLFRVVAATDQAEHSLEVILPFLQQYLGGFDLVPIVLGRSNVQRVADAIADILDDKTLLVISSDLSHYLPYQEAVARDRLTLDQLMGLDDQGLAAGENKACGIEGLKVLIALAKKFGWQPKLLHYSNSGDTAGDRNRVVGYAALAFYGEDAMASELTAAQISPEQGALLVKLARKTIVEKLGFKADPAVESLLDKGLADPVFKTRRGVFVTLHKNSQLRGCIGSLTGSSSIVEGVKRNALNAAFADHRFRPVTADELDAIEMEVSVLTEPEPFHYKTAQELIDGVRPKIDGLIIRKGIHSATFLPQVWDQLPEPEAFLSHLCQKAGLAPDEWKRGELEVLTYQVQYFAEEK